MKKTKIIHRKLGKEQADGLAYSETKEIHIDSRLKGKNYLETAIHELLHIYRTDFTEGEVDKLAKALTKDLWSLKIRRIDE